MAFATDMVVLHSSLHPTLIPVQIIELGLQATTVQLFIIVQVKGGPRGVGQGDVSAKGEARQARIY